MGNPFERFIGLSDAALENGYRRALDGDGEVIDDIDLYRAELHRRSGQVPQVTEEVAAALTAIDSPDTPDSVKRQIMEGLVSAGILRDPAETTSTTSLRSYPEDSSLPDLPPEYL